MAKALKEEIKIKCEYCEIAATCRSRSRKENFERDGWMTFCNMTPNRPGKKKAR